MNWWSITTVVIAAATILYGFLAGGVRVIDIVMNVIIWLAIVGVLRAIWLGLRHLGRRGRSSLTPATSRPAASAVPVAVAPADYPTYLRSAEWRRRREEAIHRAGGRCQLCNRRGPLEVHHRTYDRLGHELPGDLTVLCRSCHGRVHDVIGMPVRS